MKQPVKHIFLIITAFTFSLTILNAQVGINTDGSNPYASAILDVKSTDKGVLIPRMTITQRDNIANPATGLMVFITNDNNFHFFNGTAWQVISAAQQVADTDNDTKIQVEENTDEDIIRFDVGGNEKWVMTGNRLEVKNNGQSIFIGEESGLNDDLSFNANTFMGFQSGRDNTSGDANVFMGFQSGLSNTTGEDNVFVGFKAGQTNTTGGYNSFLGYHAGQYNTSGIVNVFVGYRAGWKNTTGGYNTFLGSSAGSANTVAVSNTYLGWGSGRTNTTGSYNVFVGDNSGADNTTGYNNVFIGNQAGSENTTAGFNVFVGNDAGRYNTTGVGNAFFGWGSGFSNTTGSHNVFIGDEAGYTSTGSDNVYIGRATGKKSTTGFGNVMLGKEAGHENIDGYNNVYLGRNSGYNNTNGGNNVYIGAYAGENATGSNKLYIEGSNSNSPLIYGEFNNDLLRINGALNINNAFSFPTTDGTNGQVLTTDGSGSVTWADAVTDDLGNHIATQNIQLGTNFISNDGDNEGISISTNGDIVVKSTSPNNRPAVFKSDFNGGAYIEVNNNAGTRALFGPGGSGFSGNTSDIIVGNWSNGGLKFFTNAQQRVNISNAGQFQISGDLQLINGSQGNNKILVSDVNGLSTWSDAITVSSLKITGGSPGEGKVLTTDADGDIVLEEPADRIVYRFDQTLNNDDANSLSGWHIVSDYTDPLSVKAGDVVTIRITFSAGIAGGSGTDELRFRVYSLGSGSGCSHEPGGETSYLNVYENNRNRDIQTSIQHTFVAPCDGIYNFALQSDYTNVDDNVVIDQVHITAVKY